MSKSSSDRPFVSGTRKNTRTKPTQFQAAYHAKAPVDVNAPTSGGNVMATTKLLQRQRLARADQQARRCTHKNQSHAVDNDMPKSRTAIGYASAEYYENNGVKIA